MCDQSETQVLAIYSQFESELAQKDLKERMI